MRKGTTKSGFSFEIDEKNLDDMRFTDAFGVLMDENATQAEKIIAQPVAFDLLLGKAQKKALYNFIGKDHDGRVPIQEAYQMLVEILTAADENTAKN